MSFRYKGDLAKPVEPPTIGPLMSGEEISGVAQAMVDEQYRRMVLLFDAHSVKPGDWEALCFALAKTHVPGFKVARGRAGRPQKWHDYDRAMLVLAVEETGLGVREAVQELAQQEPWKSMSSTTRGAETLRDECTRADKRWVAVAQAAKAFDALPDEEKEAARKLSGGY
ncbi:MAG: hypothetical protein JSS57_02510 [Proteobacteria bacterium]|nr:hypothetical protein [Pseudomonadota bacterium]